jgi:hypothetical protein
VFELKQSFCDLHPNPTEIMAAILFRPMSSVTKNGFGSVSWEAARGKTYAGMMGWYPDLELA